MLLYLLRFSPIVACMNKEILTVTVQPRVREGIATAADEIGVSRSWLVDKILSQWLATLNGERVPEVFPRVGA